MNFYIYENWQAGPRKAVIHVGNCGFCNKRNAGQYCDMITPETDMRPKTNSVPAPLTNPPTYS